MSRRALDTLLKVAAEEERELRYHQGIVLGQQRRCLQRCGELRGAVRRAADDLPPQLHDQYQAYAAATEARCRDLERRAAALQETSETIRQHLLTVYRRQHSYRFLQERETRRQRRLEARRLERLGDLVALRRWREACV